MQIICKQISTAAITLSALGPSRTFRRISGHIRSLPDFKKFEFGTGYILNLQSRQRLMNKITTVVTLVQMPVCVPGKIFERFSYVKSL